MNAQKRIESAALNGARIGAELGAELGADFGPALWDETQQAALALTAIESAKYFEWDGAALDWESACARIADEIRAGRSGDWLAFISALVTLKHGVFALGDRVEMIWQTVSNSSCRNGVVVLHHGKHSPKEPRVRWASGFGVSHKATTLRHMTAKEKAAAPAAKTVAGDV